MKPVSHTVGASFERSEWRWPCAHSAAAEPDAAAPSASAALVNSATDPSPPRRRPCFRVVPQYINVRDNPSGTARIIARRFADDVFEAAEEQGGWVRDGSERYGSVDGWMLIDGKGLGLGVLLERLAPGAVVKKLLNRMY